MKMKFSFSLIVFSLLSAGGMGCANAPDTESTASHEEDLVVQGTLNVPLLITVDGTDYSYTNGVLLISGPVSREIPFAKTALAVSLPPGTYSVGVGGAWQLRRTRGGVTTRVESPGPIPSRTVTITAGGSVEFDLRSDLVATQIGSTTPLTTADRAAWAEGVQHFEVPRTCGVLVAWADQTEQLLQQALARGCTDPSVIELAGRYQSLQTDALTTCSAEAGADPNWRFNLGSTYPFAIGDTCPDLGFGDHRTIQRAGEHHSVNVVVPPPADSCEKALDIYDRTVTLFNTHAQEGCTDRSIGDIFRLLEAARANSVNVCFADPMAPADWLQRSTNLWPTATVSACFDNIATLLSRCDLTIVDIYREKHFFAATKRNIIHASFYSCSTEEDGTRCEDAVGRWLVTVEKTVGMKTDTITTTTCFWPGKPVDPTPEHWSPPMPDMD